MLLASFPEISYVTHFVLDCKISGQNGLDLGRHLLDAEGWLLQSLRGICMVTLTASVHRLLTVEILA